MKQSIQQLIRRFAAAFLFCLVPFAAAAQEGDDWRVRLVGSWNEPTAGKDLGIDEPGVRLDLTLQGESGLGLAVERRLGRSLGLEVGVERTGLDFALAVAPAPSGQPFFISTADFDTNAAWVGLDWHFYEEGPWDFWVGPLAAYVRWDDTTLVIGDGGDSDRIRSGDDVVAGAQLGMAVGAGRWSFVSTMRYLDYTIAAEFAEPDVQGLRVDVEPVQLAVGVGVEF